MHHQQMTVQVSVQKYDKRLDVIFHKMKPILLILGLMLHFLVCKCCIEVDFTLIQKLENEGFHRELSWILDVNPEDKNLWLESNCNITLQLDIPSGLFVNPDAIHPKNFAVTFQDRVDIEAPAQEAKENVINIHLGEEVIHKTISIPINLRYQRGNIGGGTNRIVLKKPSILVQCTSESKQCLKGESIPCHPHPCFLKNITYKALFEDADLFVPVGDLDDYPLVSITTLLIGCAGCIYILSILSTSRI